MTWPRPPGEVPERPRLGKRLRGLTTWRHLLGGRRPEATFVVFGQSRSGSTLLVDLLDSHPDVDCRGEILFDGPIAPRVFVRAQERTSRRPVFGFKLHVHQLDYKLRLRDPAGFVHFLVDRGYRFIYLVRRNVVRHVVSDQIRDATGITHHRGAGSPGVADDLRIEVDVPSLLGRIRVRQHYWEAADRLLASVPHLRVEYERDLADAANHQATMDRVFAGLDLPPCPVSTDLRRINRRPLVDLIHNFEELDDALRGTPHHADLSAG